MRANLLSAMFTALLLCCPAPPLLAETGAVPYDIVYSRLPRPNDTTRIDFPEVKDPIRAPAGTDLMLLHPDGSEELLVAGKIEFDRSFDTVQLSDAIDGVETAIREVVPFASRIYLEPDLYDPQHVDSPDRSLLDGDSGHH